MAHPGGFLVQRPELTVGVVRATSTTSGLELDLLARRPLDRRSATERQRDIRRAEPVAVAPRRLLPAFDEGMDLRLGVLDRAGHADWLFPDYWSGSSGDRTGGVFGPIHQALFRLPPVFDEVTLVLAWPEIGFPETVVTVPLPDRAAVERATTSVWDAPVAAVPTTDAFDHHVAVARPGDAAIETGTTAAPPRVLHRSEHAVVVLTRLTAVGPDLLSAGVSSFAVGDFASAPGAAGYRPSPGAEDEAARIRSEGPGGSIAVVRGDRAFWLSASSGSFSGGGDTFSGTQDFVLDRPGDDVLDLLVTWPLAGLPDARARIPLDPL